MSVLTDFVDKESQKLRPENVPSKAQRWKDFCERYYGKLKPLSSELLEQETFQAYNKLRQQFTSESVLTCPKCKGNNVSCISRQIARADESEDFFATCMNDQCKYKWRFK